MWDNAKDKYLGITVDEVRELFEYDLTDGHLRWKASRQKVNKGQIAGYVSKSDGYRYVCFNGHDFLAHRLIWFIVTGQWPKCQIDHFDRDRSNNRWTNLREATNSQGGMNKATAQKNNKSTGVRGVDIRRGKYRVRIHVDGVEIVIGRFLTIEEAKAARQEAEEKYFGEFAPVLNKRVRPKLKE